MTQRTIELKKLIKRMVTNTWSIILVGAIACTGSQAEIISSDGAAISKDLAKENASTASSPARALNTAGGDTSLAVINPNVTDKRVTEKPPGDLTNSSNVISADKTEIKAVLAPITNEPTNRVEADKSVDTAKSSKDGGQRVALTMPPSASDEVNQSNNIDGPIIIDNDEVVEQTENLKFEELPTDDGKTRIKTGAQFPVVVSSQITSKTAKKGDPIEARLKYDLKIGHRLIAKKGSVVRGHINYCLKARSTMHSLLSPERWYRNSGCLGVSFDEIISEKGEHLPLLASPTRQARIVKNKGEGRELGVNHNGQVTGPWAQQLRYKALRIGLNVAFAPAGVFSFGAMPVALGVIGAANPSFAFMKPVGLNVRHRRIKGFAWGFLGGIPGSWLIEDTVVKGQEAVIKPGDEFLAEFKQEFTGEPATEANLLPGASTKVKGQIIDSGKNRKKRSAVKTK
jgi:hypothetical protein